LAERSGRKVLTARYQAQEKVKTDTCIISDFSTIDERDWDQLEHEDNPFLSWTFLNALEASGSVVAETGWKPHHLALFQNGQLVAFAPTYIKTHSHGEFVFDWAWADAYHRHGLQYYPKLLTAIPYTPVTGPRLLTRAGHSGSADLRNILLKLAADECERLDLSSWHYNFTGNADSAALEQTALLQRCDLQFHWSNRAYDSFDAFLRSLRSRKRKNIRRERRRVHEAGIRFEWKSSRDLTAQDLDFVHMCYCNTFRTYGNRAALRPAFFRMIRDGLADRMHVLLAYREGQALAMSLFFSGNARLYGRYWGCIEEVPGLHFEAAYYQGMDYCIEQGLDVFESGAQGEHKISRGFVPAPTRSFHLVRHEAFKSAIGEFLERESGWQDDYRDELALHNPFRRDGA
jgi:predicted N-acyltransferase